MAKSDSLPEATNAVSNCLIHLYEEWIKQLFVCASNYKICLYSEQPLFVGITRQITQLFKKLDLGDAILAFPISYIVEGFLQRALDRTLITE